jgi:hypothetical protein
MERASLSDPARHFLAHTIGSIERLDIILLMQRHPDRWWTAHALADELRIPADAVESDLGWLGTRNLLGVRIAQDVLYQYGPGTNDLRQLIEEVSCAHYADRGAIAALVARPIPEGARLFADAFRLRKGPRDG